MEQNTRLLSGWLPLLLVFAGTGSGIYFVTLQGPFYIGTGVLLLVTALLASAGFLAIEPNSSRVMMLFGKYVGTARDSGFFWANPFYTKKKISLRANNLDVKPIKVNDKHGNPIEIGAVVVWKVENTFKAAFDVDNYQSFVQTQSEAAIRKLASAYSYDNLEDEDARITLRNSSGEVNEMLEKEVAERLQMAGIHVIEARISHLAYATEIAGAMLQRQQATAILAARRKIVEGAVGMVEMALEELSRKDVVQLDDDKKAAMVSNLMVVLCSERSTTPVVNTGSLYQ
ncbi:MAG TPA: SPFH domain-containing protein [Lacibacter sp.]|mgnify:CR=1 FL=1|nr:SPFH domain-containing protein [Lacibacter sp.]HMO88840.1 SPFH domain-containing protein [Lacibacter sp.]